MLAVTGCAPGGPSSRTTATPEPSPEVMPGHAVVETQMRSGESAELSYARQMGDLNGNVHTFFTATQSDGTASPIHESAEEIAVGLNNRDAALVFDPQVTGYAWDRDPDLSITRVSVSVAGKEFPEALQDPDASTPFDVHTWVIPCEDVAALANEGDPLVPITVTAHRSDQSSFSATELVDVTPNQGESGRSCVPRGDLGLGD